MGRFAFLVALSLTLLSAPAIGAKSSDSAKTRDWSAIDTNHDHYISPEEMQAYLDRVWAQHAKKS